MGLGTKEKCQKLRQQQTSEHFQHTQYLHTITIGHDINGTQSTARASHRQLAKRRQPRQKKSSIQKRLDKQAGQTAAAREPDNAWVNGMQPADTGWRILVGNSCMYHWECPQESPWTLTLTLQMLYVIQGLLGLPNPTDDGKFCRSVWLQRRGIHGCWRQNCVRDSNDSIDSLWSFLIEMVVVASCVLMKCLWFCRATFDQIAEININIDAGHDSVSSPPRETWGGSRSDVGTCLEQTVLKLRVGTQNGIAST